MCTHIRKGVRRRRRRYKGAQLCDCFGGCDVAHIYSVTADPFHTQNQYRITRCIHLFLLHLFFGCEKFEAAWKWFSSGMRVKVEGNRFERPRRSRSSWSVISPIVKSVIMRVGVFKQEEDKFFTVRTVPHCSKCAAFAVACVTLNIFESARHVLLPQHHEPIQRFDCQHHQ